MPVRVEVNQMLAAEAEEYTSEKFPGARWQLVDVEELAALSSDSGVYLAGRRVGEGLAVLYVGQGSGDGGVGHRLRSECRWVAQVRAEANALARALGWSAHPRTLAEEGSEMWWFATGTKRDARDLEAVLVELSVVIAGAPPLLNGKAWWSERRAAREARAWFAARSSLARAT